MSLYVYLEQETPALETEHSGIFVRDNGAMREISREEWDERFLGREPVVSKVAENATGPHRVYWRNITHNLAPMAEAADLYKYLWHPDANGIERAWQLVEPLKVGAAKLRADADRFKMLNPENGWGDYAGLVEFTEDYLAACERFPDALVRVSR